jgi:hypothetical protein
MLQDGRRQLQPGLSQAARRNDYESVQFSSFQTDLAGIDSLKASTALKRRYLAEQSAFMVEFNALTKEQLLRIDDFAKGFHVLTQRVLGTLDDLYSPKEREVSLTYFNRFDAQLVALIAQFKSNERTIRVEIDDKLKKLGDEFEFVLPHHESDSPTA